MPKKIKYGNITIELVIFKVSRMINKIMKNVGIMMIAGIVAVTTLPLSKVEAQTVITDSNMGDGNYTITKGRDGTIYLDGTPYYTSAENATEAMEAEVNSISAKKKNAPKNKWYLIKSSKYNTSYDRDRFLVYSKGLSSFKLSVTSKTTVKLTGSTKFNFQSVAEVALSLSVGTEWGKTITRVVKDPEKGYKYCLDSYCKVLERFYQYNEDTTGWFGRKIKNTYKAQSHDKYGQYYAYKRTKMKK